MNVGLNVIGFLPGGFGGTETYFRNLLHYVQEIDHENNFTLLCDVQNVREFPLFNTAFKTKSYNFAKPSLNWLVRGLLRATMDIDILCPKIARACIDVIHHPFTVVNPKGLKIPSVLTFHDMQEEFYPHFFTASELRRRKATYKASVKEATRIIAISEYTRQCLVEKYGTNNDKIDVVYEGCGPEFRVLNNPEDAEKIKSKYNLKRPFLYYPATTWPHKNHKTLLLALKLMKERYHFDGELVFTSIVGRPGSEILKEIERLGLGNMVNVLGHIPYAELPYLYNVARLMVFPSLFEGFGIPLVEAMACGCPVVCSNATSIPEVVGDAGVLFNPISPEEMAEAIWSVWSDDERRQKMRLMGLDRVRFFNWEYAAKQTVEVYKKAVDFFH
ncbi:MAG: hypothetical protein QG591_1655 [Planctomycetota bacterium]|nr:hypothetical protein [Planctomycetota bacterium]